jgi:hypothetical protein
VATERQWGEEYRAELRGTALLLGGIDLLSFTHNFLRDEESDLNVSEASESAP